MKLLAKLKEVLVEIPLVKWGQPEIPGFRFFKSRDFGIPFPGNSREINPKKSRDWNHYIWVDPRSFTGKNGDLGYHTNYHVQTRPTTTLETFQNRRLSQKSTVTIEKKIHQPRPIRKEASTLPTNNRPNYSPKSAEHIRAIHMGEKPDKCDHCEESFINRHALARHVGLVHTKTSHVCHICGKSFPLIGTLKRHLKLHDESRMVTCDACGEKFKGHARLRSHRIQQHGADPLVCDECGATFSSPTGFAQHMMVHRGEKPHKCDLCSEAHFVTKKSLEDHRRTHTGERPFSCPHCEYAFKARKALVGHIKKIHTPGYVAPIRHRCPHCEKGFGIGSLLEGHVRQVHTGERPFACDQTGCGKAFAQKRSLVLHLRKTHKIGEQKTRFKQPSRKPGGTTC
ncbi:gastrula zinc finger protein XlCGF26.1 [Folsomia candida]|uniref:gastrula zinc finger protein XlCGF26.1 n=1 Tax=Folsomia candida TaxID=158441 RepID=UPI00160545A0|nr:gastrula zinc finger protein XlCGF26.1 [Folsomia candida]